MNIYQRINEVRKAVEYVQKDATIQGYKAVTHDNVTAILRPHLLEHGIVVSVSQSKGKLLQVRDGQSVKQHLYEGRYIVRFVNMDDPKDAVECEVHAHAADTSDKAPGKAMSYATKYAMLKTFSLETGENEEGRYHETPQYTPEQFDVYHELIDQSKAYEFYLFTATLSEETSSALYNSFPDGKKTQGKRAASDLSAKGVEKFNEVVEEVQTRLASQDISVLEVTDEMSVLEKKFLASRLSEFEVKQLGKLKEASA